MVGDPYDLVDRLMSDLDDRSGFQVNVDDEVLEQWREEWVEIVHGWARGVPWTRAKLEPRGKDEEGEKAWDQRRNAK